jgi:Questin oxidase-like
MDESSLTSQRDVLENLLDEELAFDATTTKGLTNHLPMALVAKSGLGASSTELRRFATRYERRLAPRSDVDIELTAATWRSAIGHVGSFEVLCDYFRRAVNDDGPAATMERHLDALFPGICGAAFHGAIRLAYALELSSPSRIAAGLAYLAESAIPLGEPIPSHPSDNSVLDVLAQLSSSHEFAALPSRGLISEEMLDVAAMETFRNAVATCRIDDDTIDDLRRAALTLYATTGDFTSLHAVTGVEALTALRPYAQDVASFDAACVVGVAAAYATIGAPPLASPERLHQFITTNDATVDQVAAIGANSDDEHVSKLVYTSLRLHANTNDDLYLAVAARKAGLTASS